MSDAKKRASAEVTVDVSAGIPATLPHTEQLRLLTHALHDIGCVKFGEFTLKSGLKSPVYIDLRELVSHPALMRDVARILQAAASDASYDLVCGVPYTALPLATLMSVAGGVPMLMRRKEAKAYGTAKAIEGAYKPGQRCLIVEDLVTSGASIAETVRPLRELGLHVDAAVVVVDREQGGVASLQQELGVHVRPLLTVSGFVRELHSSGRLSAEMVAAVEGFVKANQTKLPAPAPAPAAPSAQVAAINVMGLAQRFPSPAAGAGAGVVFAYVLASLMSHKQSNLCLSADVHDANDLLALVAAAGPSVVIVKTHADAVRGWTAATERALVRLAREHCFLLFEDRKVADIGSTVSAQTRLTFKWAHCVTVHALPGPGVLAGIKEGIKAAGASTSTSTSTKTSGGDGGESSGDECGLCPAESTAAAECPFTTAMRLRGVPDWFTVRGALLLTQMSSQGALTDASYSSSAVKMAEQDMAAADGVVGGVIAQERASSLPGMLVLTPGVQLNTSTSTSTSAGAGGADGLGQQYNSPGAVVGERGTDIIIVGRGITGPFTRAGGASAGAAGAAAAREAAARYRDEAWTALRTRTGEDGRGLQM